MKTTKPKAAPVAEDDEVPTQILEKSAPAPEAPAAPSLPPISAQMQAFLDKSFNAFPGRWYYHLERFAVDLESQLVSRGLIERGEFESKGRKLIRYRAKPIEGSPPSLEHG